MKKLWQVLGLVFGALLSWACDYGPTAPSAREFCSKPLVDTAWVITQRANGTADSTVLFVVSATACVTR